jgi:ferritin-like protein
LADHIRRDWYVQRTRCRAGGAREQPEGQASPRGMLDAQASRSMADSSSVVHEDGLSTGALDRHRAIVSLMEELEAVDWYAQRSEAATDPELRSILEHNGEEEREHAAMLLEWLRRTDAGFRENLAKYLSRPGSIVAAEQAEKADTATANASDGSLGIGSLKGK